jgi:L-iditol 2-dehydrogenase
VRAVRLVRVGTVRLADVPPPAVSPGEVVVKVTVAGICGSDRHLRAGEYPSEPPVTLGHEVEGVVGHAGPGSSLRPGRRVAIDPNIPCSRCQYCRRGLVCHCLALRAVGVDRDGGLAELVIVPESQVYELPDDLPAGLGALCEPLACCLRAMDQARVQPGDSVAVFGGGVIGQMLAQLARLSGGRVVLVTRQRAKRALAESLGAHATVGPAADGTVSAISGAGGFAPGGVDVAFEAAGVADTFHQAVAVARRAGTVVVVGAAPSAMTVPVRPFDIFARELRVVGSHLNPFTHRRAVELVASGSLDLTPLVTRTVDLGDVPGLLEHEPQAGEVKVHAVP